MKPTNVKGTRDLIEQDALLMNYIVDTLKKIFEKYGFQPFYTSVLEYSETLKTKISDEILGLIYEFKDKGNRDIGLRYDLTLGLARVAANKQLNLPFKRYQIEKAYRYESPGKGRYREFWQADIDILGVNNAKADAECLACFSESLQTLNLNNFTIRINSRELLDEILNSLGIKNNAKVYQIIDKVDKIGLKNVEQELNKLIGKAKTKKLLTILRKSNINKYKSSEKIKELIDCCKYYKINNKIKVDLFLVRGLAYYTGLIFEISYGKENLSIAGGGRYDDLISKLGGNNTPATGISLGLDRVLEILKEKKQIKTLTKTYIIPISKEQEKYSTEILQNLRKENINADITLGERSISKNLNYTNKQKIPYVIIIGKEEIKTKKLTLKNMESGKEEKLNINQIIKKLK